MIFDNESLWAMFGTVIGIFIGSFFTYGYMKVRDSKLKRKEDER